MQKTEKSSHPRREVAIARLLTHTPYTVTPRGYATYGYAGYATVTPYTVTPHGYATCGYAGYATVTPNTVTPHGYATCGYAGYAEFGYVTWLHHTHRG